MTYSFVLRDEAVREYTEAFIWYEEQQDGLGQVFKRAIQNKLKSICDNPVHYKISYKNYHEALADKFPFLIIYTVDEKAKLITVMAVFHTSRNPKRKFRK